MDPGNDESIGIRMIALLHTVTVMFFDTSCEYTNGNQYSSFIKSNKLPSTEGSQPKLITLSPKDHVLDTENQGD